MQNKKGVSMALTAVIVAVLLFLYFLFASGYLGKAFSTFGAGYDDISRKADVRSCSVQSGLAEVLFDKDFGTEGDTFGDACDFCLGGDDRKDADSDGVPDACDPDDTKAPEKKAKIKDICETDDVEGKIKITGKIWDKERGQCRLACYNNYIKNPDPKNACKKV